MAGQAASNRVDRQVDWQEFARCKGYLHLFFAKKAERPQARERREAKARALCNECPVIDQCRESARTNREYGFWAGENEEDRHFSATRCRRRSASAPVSHASRPSPSHRRADPPDGGVRRPTELHEDRPALAGDRGGPQPARLREALRAPGPSNDTHGKQAGN